MPPIDLSTLYNKTDTRLPNSGKDYTYTRINNQTRAALERSIAGVYLVENVIPVNNVAGAYYSLTMMVDEPKEIVCLSTRQSFREMIERIIVVQNMGVRLRFTSAG